MAKKLERGFGKDERAGVVKTGTGGRDVGRFWKKLWDLVLETKQSL